MDVLAGNKELNARALILPFALTMLGLVVAVHVILVVRDNRIGVLETLPLVVVAGYYAFFLITRGSELRQIRFGRLVAHATAYVIVNVGYLLHAYVLIVVNSPAIRGDSHFLLDEGWFGATFSMATFWGLGLLVHAIASIAGRGWEERP